MGECFVEYWNEVVSPNDVVYYLGDLSMNPHIGAKYISRCNGRRVLISGNHDRCWKGQDRWIDFYKNDCGFIEVFPRGVFPRLILRWDNGIDYTGLHIRLSHVPYDVNDGRYEEWLPVEDGTWVDMMLCGHVHTSWNKRVASNGILMINVGVDVHNFRPVPEQEIIKTFLEHKCFKPWDTDDV